MNRLENEVGVLLENLDDVTKYPFSKNCMRLIMSFLFLLMESSGIVLMKRSHFGQKDLSVWKKLRLQFSFIQRKITRFVWLFSSLFSRLLELFERGFIKSVLGVFLNSAVNGNTNHTLLCLIPKKVDSRKVRILDLLVWLQVFIKFLLRFWLTDCVKFQII